MNNVDVGWERERKEKEKNDDWFMLCAICVGDEECHEFSLCVCVF